MLPNPNDDQSAALSADLAGFLNSVLGTFNLLGGRIEGESKIWELTSGEGERLFLKQTSAHAFDRELLAYRDWLPSLANTTPKLVSYRCSTRRRLLLWLKKLGIPKGLTNRVSPKTRGIDALLLSAAPGQRTDRLPLSTTQQQALHFQAGRFLKELHQLPGKSNGVPYLGATLRNRAERWARRANGIITEAAIGWVLNKVITTRYRYLSSVPCHWDYQPRNWFVDLSNNKIAFYVIDFGDARYDVWLADLRKLYGGAWVHRPDLQSAFLRGYGRELTGDECNQLRALAALDRLEAIIWSAEHQHAKLEAHNRKALEWLMSEDI